MKRTLLVLAALVCFAAMVLALPVSGDEITGICGDGVGWALKDGVLTVSGTGEITSNPWIEHKDEIREVIIEEGVTAICDEAFMGCGNLYGATIAASVRKIGSLAFQTGAVLEAFFKGDAPEIHDNWYVAPDFNGLGPNAFIHYQQGNESWENFDVPRRTILRAVNYDLTGTCGENLTYAIEGTTLTVSGNGEILDYNESDRPLWSGHSLVIKKVVIEEGVTKIAFNAFTYFRALEIVEIPDTVTYIDNNAFSNCEKLRAVELPKGLTYIGDGAFRNCKSLEEIHIYGAVDEIGIEAFAGCDSLKKVWFHGDAPTWLDAIFGFEDRFDLTAYYPEGNETWTEKALSYAGDNVTWKTWNPNGADVEPTEPKPTEPKPTDPEPTEPKPTEPEVTEPLETTPVETVPAATAPENTEPEKETAPDPTEAKPVGTQPEADPVVTEPGTEPVTNETQPVDGPGTAEAMGSDMGWVAIVAIAVLAVAVGCIVLLKKRMK